jgi:hypothetical protein
LKIEDFYFYIMHSAGYSPWYSRGLEVQSHRLQVMPMGAECRERERLSIDFDIIKP